MSTLIKHRNINNSLIPKLNIPDTIHLKEAGILYWDIAKISLFLSKLFVRSLKWK